MVEKTMKSLNTMTLKDQMPPYYFKDIVSGDEMDFIFSLNHEEFLKIFQTTYQEKAKKKKDYDDDDDEDDDDDFDDDDEEEEAEEDDSDDIIDLDDQNITGIYFNKDGVITARLNLLATMQTFNKKAKKPKWKYGRDIHATIELKLRIGNKNHFPQAGIHDHVSKFEIEPLSLELTNLGIRSGMKMDKAEESMIFGMKAALNIQLQALTKKYFDTF